MALARVILSQTLAALLTSTCFGQTMSETRIPKRFAHTLELVRENNCEDAWKELWRDADINDYDAIFWLNQILFLHRFDIKNISHDEFVSLYVPMQFFSLLSSEESQDSAFPKDSIRNSLKIILSKLPYHTKHDSTIIDKCVDSKRPIAICVNLAIKLNIIPRYVDYIAYISSRILPNVQLSCSANVK